MELTEFRNCCGIDILSSLYGTQAEMQRALSACLSVRDKKSLIVAATSEEQPTAEEFLQSKGFKAATTFRNLNSGNDVTLWFLNTNGKKLT